MATTFATNYDLVDSVNTQSPAATQYNTNEGSGSLSKDSYAPTSSSTHTIPSALRDLSPGALLNDGYSQKALYELLLMIQVNWDNAMKQLDDSSTGRKDFEDSCTIGSLHGVYSAENTTTFGGATTQMVTLQGIDTNINIHKNGISTRKLATLCQAIAHSFNSCLDLCDGAATLDDTDYNDERILFTAKTASCPPLTASTIVFNINNEASKIRVNGINQEALMDFLNTVVTQMNALWAKLDGDI